MAINDFWCLTTYFNPAHYKSRARNHHIYAENMAKQNVNFLIIEHAFGNDPFELPYTSNLMRLRSNSILWPKERMLNYALTKLPPECKYIAWIDGDVLFPDSSWVDCARAKFEAGNDILQLFSKVKHLPPEADHYSGSTIMEEKGLVWQYNSFAGSHEEYIKTRKTNKLLYATTGFAWAGRKSLFEKGFYDKHILGANDNVIIDCCLNTFELHHYYRAGQGTPLINDMMNWAKQFGNPKADYLDIPIYHLFHGAKKNRGYLTREDIVKNHNYDPNIDIKLVGDVYEWATDKPALHTEVKNYFSSRKEDEIT